MKPRIEIIHKLLRDDGTLWIFIDDDESHYLKVLCNEVFGRKNFVNNVIWEKKFSPQNDAKWLSDSRDHILVYAKNKDIWRPNLLPRTAEMDSRYKNPDESLLICCKSFQEACENRYPNITVKKIPNMLLGRCEFGREDYSLNSVNIPVEADEEKIESHETNPTAIPSQKESSKGRTKKKIVQRSLFAEEQAREK